MADSAAAPSSSSSNSSVKKYHVFISFRGEDTRKTFTSHLYRAFTDKKINAYIDEESLEKGDEISPALIEAIEESMISVVVLSENYASSRWCLDELNQSLRCNETDNQIVVPVFYRVDPSQVRKQQGGYASAFAGHEDRFRDQMDKVQQWRNSLTRVADFSGFDSSNYGSDSKLVEAILKDILNKLHQMSPSVEFKGLAGIKKRVQHVESLLNIDSSDTSIVGLWGMGGIGKTTLARVIFNRFANQFEGSYFLENVKEQSEKHGSNYLQKLFSEILLEERSLNMISQFVKNRLRCTKVFIVLDNVDNVQQFEYLARDCDWFGCGSKIIITTRDRHVLENIQNIEIYKVEELNFEESLRLFCSKAFQQSYPTTNYRDLSQRVVDYAKGIPLALIVLGSHFYSKSTEQWESELNKLKKIPNKAVHDILKISYDGLDSDEKELFLDIACFFKGKDAEFVKRILDAYGTRFFDSARQVLIDRALITVDFFKKLRMHDLLQDMGRQIVCQESKEPGKRSRLWSPEDIYQILKYNTGTGAIEGMSLESFYKLRGPIDLNPLAFKGMYNLKFLKISDVSKYLHLPQGLESFPDELRYLFWDTYPSEHLPLDFTPQNLVELHLYGSQLKQLWNGDPNVENLTVLNLGRSKNLIQIPDLSGAMKLEAMYLGNCTCFEKFPKLSVNIKHLDMSWTLIEEVPPSIGSLSHLVTFVLVGCKRLKSVPTTICKLKSLQRLDLQYCSDLEYFPEILEPMEHFTYLGITYSGIKELPSSIENLVGLRHSISLSLNSCKNLQFVPLSIYNMRFLYFDLSDCSKLENLPPFSTGLRFLKSLTLDRAGISEIPDWFFWLPSLEVLSLHRTGIRALPTSIIFSRLRELYIRDCKFLQSLPMLPLSIREIDASGCTSLEMGPNITIPVLTQEEFWKNLRAHSVFTFIDCVNLDCENIIREFQNIALRLTTEFSTRKSKQLCGSNYEVYVSFPGDEIPKWFNYQNNGCLINVKLHTNRYNATNFGVMAIAACIVVARGNDEKRTRKLMRYAVQPTFEPKCQMYVKTNKDERKYFSFIGPIKASGKEPISSHHMLMWYFSVKGIDLPSAEEMLLYFHPYIYLTDSDVDFKVERCGIRMLPRCSGISYHRSEVNL